MKTTFIAMGLIAALATVGCGNKTDDSSSASTPPANPAGSASGGMAAPGGASGAGKVKAQSGFHSTAAGQNAESRLGSAGK